MTHAVEKDLLGLEKQYWQALKERDVDAAVRLTDDPCIVTGAQGAALVHRIEENPRGRNEKGRTSFDLPHKSFRQIHDVAKDRPLDHRLVSDPNGLAADVAFDLAVDLDVSGVLQQTGHR